jgi:hypothetical protein
MGMCCGLQWGKVDKRLKATCPKCGYILHVKRRADGTGSEPKGDMSIREAHLLGLLRGSGAAMTVREIQTFIFANQERPLSGGFSWNYHLIQATASTLAGRGLVKMQRTDRAWSYKA